MSDHNEINPDILNDDTADEENYITLTDDDGEDIHFEIIDEFEFNGNTYAVLLPFEDVDDEVVILEIIHADSPDDDEYVSIENEDVLNNVFEEFKRRNADNFDFED